MLYCSCDGAYFASHTLLDLADQFYKTGGKHLFLDEIHKYPNWSREIKEMTDDEALEAVEKMFASQERALAVKRAYYERFKEKLTPQQLFRLFRPKNERRRAAQGQGPFGPGMPPPPGMGGGFHGRPGFWYAWYPQKGRQCPPREKLFRLTLNKGVFQF